jgi:hypothetical protein
MTPVVNTSIDESSGLLNEEPRGPIRLVSLRMKHQNDRHYLHEFMTDQRSRPQVTTFSKCVNFALWVVMVSLLAQLAYLFVHG